MTRNFPKLAPLIRATCTLLLATTAFTASLRAQRLPSLDAVRVAGGFILPLFITTPPGDTARLFIVQQGGQIRIIDLATKTIKPVPFLDLSDVVTTTGEEGLLGLAFDRNYATNGRFYVNYVARGGTFHQG